MPSLDAVTEADEPPQLLTVDEAARLLRIGRSRGYELANEYLSSGVVRSEMWTGPVGPDDKIEPGRTEEGRLR